MRSDLKEPARVNFNHIPHKLLSCHYKFMINYALGLILIQHGAWVYLDTHSIFRCLVDLVSM